MASLPNELIIDANILFSFFKSDSVRRHLIEELLNNDCKLSSPEFALKELLSDKEKIIKFSGISESDFTFNFSILEKEIKVVLEDEYEEFLSEANKISPHNNSTKDDPYFALALSYNSPIWSDETAFKEQSKVKVFSTKDLLKLLSTPE